jgi:hypothetical protein
MRVTFTAQRIILRLITLLFGEELRFMEPTVRLPPSSRFVANTLLSALFSNILSIYSGIWRGVVWYTDTRVSEGINCFHFRGRFLRNVDTFLRDYTASHP